MSSRKLYDDLGLDPSATTGEVKKAYRKKAKKSHPDKGGSTEEFNRVNKAYLILSDPDRRSRYDQTGEENTYGADNERSNIMAIVAGAMSCVIGAIEARGRDPLRFDLLGEMKASIKTEIGKQRAEITRLQANVKKTERLLGKFKVKSGENFLEQMIKAQAMNIGLNARQKEEAVKPFEAALDLLKDVEFLQDKTPEPTAANQDIYAAMKMMGMMGG